MKFRILVSILGFTSSQVVFGQSLLQMYEIAKEYDSGFLAAKSQYESVQYKTEQIYALRRPNLNLQGYVGKTQSNSNSLGTSLTTASNNGTVLSQYTSLSNQDVDSTDKRASLNLQYNLFNRANDITIQQAEISLQASKYIFNITEQDLIIRLTKAYFDVIAARDALVFIEAEKIAIQQQLAAATRKFEIGTVNILDTKNAQARFDLILADEIKAKNDLEIKIKILNQLTGITESNPYRLSSGKDIIFTPADEKFWLEIARNQSPQIKIKELDLEISKLEINKSKAADLPTLSINGTIINNNPTGQSINRSILNSSVANGTSPAIPIQNVTTSTIPGHSTTKTIGLTLNIPLFAGFATQNRIKETTVLAEKYRHELEGTEGNVNLTVRTLILEIRAGIALIKALEAAELSSQSLLKYSNLGYEIGELINIDVLNSQSQLFKTKRDLAKARYDVLLGQLKLRQAAGVLKAEDVQTLNSLFGQ